MCQMSEDVRNIHRLEPHFVRALSQRISFQPRVTGDDNDIRRVLLTLDVLQNSKAAYIRQPVIKQHEFRMMLSANVQPLSVPPPRASAVMS